VFEWLGDALAAVLSGGATGLLGAAFTTWGELTKLKEANRHAEAMAVHDLALAKAEAEGKLAIARSEGEAAIGVAEANALAASYGHDRATYYTGELGPVGRGFMVFVDFLRGIIRPAETLYFTGLCTWLTVVAVRLLEQLDASASVEIVKQLVPQVVLVVLYLTTTIILWWFGARQKILKP